MASAKQVNKYLLFIIKVIIIIINLAILAKY